MGAQGNPIVGLFPIILMFVIFYFLLIRPQQRQRKEHQKLIESLSKNDEVITSGFGGMFRPGIPIGKVLRIGRDKGMLYRYAVVKPLENLSTLEEVLCVE